MTFTPTGAKRPAMMDAGPPMGILSGVVNITSYATVHVAAAALLNYFKPGGVITVVCDGVSAAGTQLVRWDPATRDFFLYTALTPVEASNAAAATFNIIAFGQMG
jgi:hypothetical protein